MESESLGSWFHCNGCLLGLISSGCSFHLSSCGHIICHKCMPRTKRNNQCSFCGQHSPRFHLLDLTSLPSSLETHFQDVCGEIQALFMVTSFQEGHHKSLTRGLQEQICQSDLALAKAAQRNEKAKAEVLYLRKAINKMESEVLTRVKTPVFGRTAKQVSQMHSPRFPNHQSVVSRPKPSCTDKQFFSIKTPAPLRHPTEALARKMTGWFGSHKH